MTTELATQLRELTRRQKLDLADRLLAAAGAHTKPSPVRASDDPSLAAELRRRLKDQNPDAWLSVDQFRERNRSR